jgi:hypothetical protein
VLPWLVGISALAVLGEVQAGIFVFNIHTQAYHFVHELENDE